MGNKAAKRAAALDTLKEAAKEDDMPPQAEAIFTLVHDMLDSLERIAEALEKRATIAPLGAGSVMGELAKFEPAIDPEMLARIVRAAESIAAKR